MVPSVRVLCDDVVSVDARLDSDELQDDLTPMLDRVVTQVSRELEGWARDVPGGGRRRGRLVVLVLDE